MSDAHDGPHLVIGRGDRTHTVTLSDARVFTIGRSPENAIVIDDGSMSRRHALLERLDDGQFYVVDLGSRNGSFVNNRRVSFPALVRDGDAVRLGDTECEFRWPSAGRPATVVQQGPGTVALQVRRLITVLVVDIRDFTPLTRRSDERILSQAVSGWFRDVGVVVHAAGGHIDKYIGDGFMAVWFHGEAGPTPDVMRAMLVAVDKIQRLTGRVHESFPLPHALRVGAGVNTGFAVTGNAGTRERPDYTALGDTVNAAFRLESATKQVQRDLAIGEDTWTRLGNLQDGSVFERASLMLKGYDQPTFAYIASFTELASLLARTAR